MNLHLHLLNKLLEWLCLLIIIMHLYFPGAHINQINGKLAELHYKCTAQFLPFFCPKTKHAKMTKMKSLSPSLTPHRAASLMALTANGSAVLVPTRCNHIATVLGHLWSRWSGRVTQLCITAGAVRGSQTKSTSFRDLSTRHRYIQT